MNKDSIGARMEMVCATCRSTYKMHKAETEQCPAMSASTYWSSGTFTPQLTHATMELYAAGAAVTLGVELAGRAVVATGYTTPAHATAIVATLEAAGREGVLVGLRKQGDTGGEANPAAWLVRRIATDPVKGKQ